MESYRQISEGNNDDMNYDIPSIINQISTIYVH
jgi:hypothetical protein